MDKRPQQLNLATTLGSGDFLPLAPSGTLTAKKVTLANLSSYLPSRVVYVTGYTQASPYYAEINDNVLLCHHDISVTNVYLPNPSGNFGMKYSVKDWKGTAPDNNIVILGNGWKYDSQASIAISTNYGCRTYISDGDNYAEISNSLF